MTVRELIEELSKYPQDIEVALEQQECGWGILCFEYVESLNANALEENQEEWKGGLLILKIR